MRNLENRLDKAELKCNEAEQIKKTYLQIKAKLEEEALGFPNQLNSMEGEIKRLRLELKDLKVRRCLRQKNKLNYLLPLFLFMQKHPFIRSYKNAWGRQESAIMQSMLPSVLQSPTAIFWHRPNSEKKYTQQQPCDNFTIFTEKIILSNQITIIT